MKVFFDFPEYTLLYEELPKGEMRIYFEHNMELCGGVYLESEFYSEYLQQWVREYTFRFLEYESGPRKSPEMWRVDKFVGEMVSLERVRKKEEN